MMGNQSGSVRQASGCPLELRSKRGVGANRIRADKSVTVLVTALQNKKRAFLNFFGKTKGAKANMPLRRIGWGVLRTNPVDSH